MDINDQILFTKKAFANSSQLLIAIGNETRLAIIAALMFDDCYAGLRVRDIAEATHLSRATVSHHLKILRDAGIIEMIPKGTMNFYSLYLGKEWDELTLLINMINSFAQLDDNL